MDGPSVGVFAAARRDLFRQNVVVEKLVKPGASFFDVPRDGGLAYAKL